jgi:DNA helicase II / ATP-dependent DNA helicase PcrA
MIQFRIMATTDTQPLLSDLTDAQRQAVTHVDGPLLIIAAAGSGKTRVITRRVAYLISLGIPPPSILAITFTNKAAEEMKRRVAAVCQRPLRDFGKLDQPWPILCTFHSLCLRILRHYGSALGMEANFTIFDSADQTKLIKEAIESAQVSSTNFAPAAVHGAISKAKNQLISAEQYARDAGDYFARVVARIYTKYQQLLAVNHALDFDDLLLRTCQALRSHPQILEQLQERFAYILIDEYQDTNHAQYILAHALAMRRRNLCVVGDPDQSIYAWRGADIQNILDFEKDYPDAKIVRLEQNYRSTKTILAIAGDLISRNVNRKDKRLWTENGEGEKARVFYCPDEHEEADAVARELIDLHDKQHYAWNQMAIFYRINALSRVMEQSLRQRGVPYQIARGVEFYNRKEIKDVLAYLRVLANPADELSLLRIINVPTRGVGDAAVKSLQAHAAGAGVSLWAALEQSRQIPGLSARAASGAAAFVAIIESLRKKLTDGSNAKAIMEQVVEKSGLQAMLEKIGGDEQDELNNVNELISSAAEFQEENPQGALADYLAAVSLVSDVDQMKDGGGAVTLMTLHAAKGLEFPVVAIIGLEEGCLPHARARGDLNQLEEERRLCFVGITRAQERLILSKAAWRTMRGMREPTIASPFLFEMPADRLQIIDRGGMDSGGGGYSNRRAMETPFEDRAVSPGRFHRGQRVRHPIFGLGRIEEVSASGEQTRAVVDFATAGRKTLILQFARLEAIG